jgi:hypothetical protein
MAAGGDDSIPISELSQAEVRSTPVRQASLPANRYARSRDSIRGGWTLAAMRGLAGPAILLLSALAGRRLLSLLPKWL